MSQPKVVLITGASGGIGRACAIALSKAYPENILVLSGRREAELQATADQCQPDTKVEIITGDVSNEEEVGKMFDTIKTKYGRMDVLFNVSLFRLH